MTWYLWFVGAVDSTSTVGVANVLAYAVFAGSAAVLLGHLVGYARDVLVAETVAWWYIAVAAGAAVIYGLAGVTWEWTAAGWLSLFVDGAILFFILFLGLGLRALYHSGHRPANRTRRVPVWVDYLVVAAFVTSWWVGFLGEADWIQVVVGIGWVLASGWAVIYGLLTVRVHEGTTLAAITRHLLPAVVCVVAIVFTDLGAPLVGATDAHVDAVWLVGTVLAAAFVFNTALAIRQVGGELQRLYDWTTWREQTLED